MYYYIFVIDKSCKLFMFIPQERQIAMVRDLLFYDGGRNLNDETREKLQFLNNTTLNRQSNLHIQDMHTDK